MRYDQSMETQEKILSKIQCAGLRLTRTRQALTAVFLQSRTPLSVPELLVKLKKSGVVVNKTTVYRELERLEALNLVRSVKLAPRRASYELATREHHHHLVCVSCETVEDIDIAESELTREEKKVKAEKQFTVLRHSLEFFGLCQKCQTT